jgi:hypothetical protein
LEDPDAGLQRHPTTGRACSDEVKEKDETPSGNGLGEKDVVENSSKDTVAVVEGRGHAHRWT